ATSPSISTVAEQAASAPSSTRTRIVRDGRSGECALRAFPRPGSQQFARLGEVETRRAREQAGLVAITEIDQEIRFPAAAGEKGLVHHCLVEPRHRPAIEA